MAPYLKQLRPPGRLPQKGLASRPGGQVVQHLSAGLLQSDRDSGMVGEESVGLNADHLRRNQTKQ